MSSFGSASPDRYVLARQIEPEPKPSLRRAVSRRPLGASLAVGFELAGGLFKVGFPT
jgi:hypothetical protein